MNKDISDKQLYTILNLFKIENYINHTEDAAHYRITMKRISCFAANHWLTFVQRFNVDPMNVIEDIRAVHKRVSQSEIDDTIDLLIAKISGDRNLEDRVDIRLNRAADEEE